MKELLIKDQLINKVIYKEEAGKDKTGLRLCKFLCYCGKEFISRLGDVKRNKVESCGCYNKKRIKETHTTHGHTVGIGASPEYVTWSSIIRRCERKDIPEYKHYGGRGISICKEWRDSFEQFYKDMGNRPGPEYSIDRIDVNGNYEPCNCRWATTKEQARNKRNNIIIEYKGEKKPLIEWAEIKGIKYNVLRDRLQRDKWSIKEALETPKGRSHSIPWAVNQYTIDDVFIKTWNSIKEICEYYKVDRSCISEACTGKIKTSRGFKWRYA
jgi:hypothetical protein